MKKININIDHVATIRNARGGHFPDPLQAAKLIEQTKASGITIHLREDRRHIKDEDAINIKIISCYHLISNGCNR